MKQVTNDELIKTAMKENRVLQHQIAKAKSDIDYIAMMTEVEMETATEEVDDEQI